MCFFFVCEVIMYSVNKTHDNQYEQCYLSNYGLLEKNFSKVSNIFLNYFKCTTFDHLGLDFFFGYMFRTPNNWKLSILTSKFTLWKVWFSVLYLFALLHYCFSKCHGNTMKNTGDNINITSTQ